MNANYISPFLDSACTVIEQVSGVKPSAGELCVKEVIAQDGYFWIHVGITGQVDGDIMFGLHEEVALKVVSAMMGGYVLTELGEMGQSAISELGNMISGNASTILYNSGVKVDITPPKIIQAADALLLKAKKALSVPLRMEGIGHLDIQLLIA